MLLAWILQGFSIESWGSGLALAAVLGLLNALVWPLLIRVALPLTVITLGFGVLLLNGVFVWLASDILADSVQISGLWTAVVVALGLTLINNTVTLFLGIDDDDLYYREVIKRHARKSKETAAPTRHSGGACFWRSTGSRTTCSCGRCGTEAHRRWPPGCATAPTR